MFLEELRFQKERTGQGNIIGNPIEPVIKLTANPLTAKTMSEHIDVDVSKILSRQMNLEYNKFSNLCRNISL